MRSLGRLFALAVMMLMPCLAAAGGRRRNVYPGTAEYASAVQKPAKAFLHPDLRKATTVLDTMGDPYSFSGRSVIVFKLSSGGKLFAVRCFADHDPVREQRYQQLSDYLRAHPTKDIANFEYLPRGIQIGSEAYPIVKMDWLEGVALDRHINSLLSRGNAKQLEPLAEKWRQLVLRLRGLNVAHGDLQHGNILVSASGDMTLVDPDGLFIPSLQAVPPQGEGGLPSYQHPGRKAGDYSLEMDNFSSFVIYLSLRALAAEPGLWNTGNFNNGENLIFRQGDLEDPSSSELIERLRNSPSQEVRKLTETLLVLLEGPAAGVPPLEQILTGHAPPPSGAGGPSASPATIVVTATPNKQGTTTTNTAPTGSSPGPSTTPNSSGSDLVGGWLFVSKTPASSTQNLTFDQRQWWRNPFDKKIVANNLKNSRASNNTTENANWWQDEKGEEKGKEKKVVASKQKKRGGKENKPKVKEKGTKPKSPPSAGQGLVADGP